MAADSTSATKPAPIAINGSTSGYTPRVQDDINMALLANGGIVRIQRALQQRLDESGWSQALREYVERLYRAGDAITYDDALKLVLRQIELQPERDHDGGGGGGGSGAAGRKGGARANGAVTSAPDLTIPREAARGAAETVKKELAQVVKMEK